MGYRVRPRAAPGSSGAGVGNTSLDSAVPSVSAIDLAAGERVSAHGPGGATRTGGHGDQSVSVIDGRPGDQPVVVPDTDAHDRTVRGTRRRRAPSRLRRRLVRWDAVTVSLSWLVPLAARLRMDPGPGGVARLTAEVLLAVAATMVALYTLRLYRGHVCLDRREARLRLAAASVAPVLPLMLVDPANAEGSAALVAGVVAAFVALAVEREVYEQWLRAARVRGRHLRPVVLAGGFDEVRRMALLLEAHPETGCRPIGYVGEAPTAAGGLRWLGPADRLAHIGGPPAVTAVLAAPSVLGSPGFTDLARELHARDVLVQLWSGLWGVDPRRLRRVRLAHEAFFDLRPASSQARLLWLKRAIDVIVASTVLVVTSPVLAVAAVLIRRHDGGPVLFRQERVGQHGEVFELRKLRTMAVDAEARLEELRHGNERHGPLFKLARDPRVTPVGRVLRATSIDELPQLLDVLAGRLSIVGPRPALPSEVAEFDQALLGRHDVLPGITGLWQVEARHNPSFDAYRHLDLFYVENWNVQLDIAILLATVKTVIADSVGALGSLWNSAEAKERV